MRLVRDFLSAKLDEESTRFYDLLRLVRDFLSAKLAALEAIGDDALRLVRDFLSAKLLSASGRHPQCCGWSAIFYRLN